MLFHVHRYPADICYSASKVQLIRHSNRTTRTNLRPVGAPEPKACDARFHFFHHQPFYSSSPSLGKPQQEGNSGKLFFTGVIGWESKDAMQAWCTEYGVGCEIYERLGYQIDALQLVCPEVENVKSRFLNVNIHSLSGRRTKRSRRLGIGID
jgi:hypothetical protein